MTGRRPHTGQNLCSPKTAYLTLQPSQVRSRMRHGIVYAGGKAWTAAHDAWLLKQHFDVAGMRAAFEDAYETVALAGAAATGWTRRSP